MDGRALLYRAMNPIEPMIEALDNELSLILFPEGTRGTGEEVQPFKCGIFHLAKARPHVELIPVWMKNACRVMPKGVSRSKTVEGLVGGVACATAIGAALWRITPFHPWQAAGMAFTITMMGFLGGLVMSAVKRDRGVKDWGQLIAGHGGMLDRLDLVAFSAPIFFHLTRYFFAACFSKMERRIPRRGTIPKLTESVSLNPDKVE